MATQWMLRGVNYANCNCNYGCPCQFNAPTSHGNCEGVVCGHIEEGYHGDTRLAGLDWAWMFWYPGEVAEGNGRAQFVIDQRADDAQREALGRILNGEDTVPGATIFAVLSSTISELLETLYAPIELDIDVDERKGRLNVSRGRRVHGLTHDRPVQWRAFPCPYQSAQWIRVHGCRDGLRVVEVDRRHRVGTHR